MTFPAGSSAFERFVLSIDSPEVDFRESLDLDALARTEGPDREAAESILIARVSEEDDWRVPPAIASIQLKRAVPPMQRRLPGAKGRMLLALARALVELGALDRIDDTVVEMLDGGDRDEGISALAASSELSSPELVAALSRACVHHPSPEVRVNSGAELLYVTGATRDPLAWKLRPLYLLLADEDEGKRREAFREICKRTRTSPALETRGARVPSAPRG